MYNKQIVNSINHHELVSDSTLHVVAVVSNPVRYHSRYRLFREFQERMLKTDNVKLYVVETAHGDRHHEVTDTSDLTHLQLRTSHNFWHKECMINLGVRHLLPRDWKYTAWIDADVTFLNPNWAIETIHALQHYPVVQPWSEAIDMGPFGNVLQMFRSFCSLVSKDITQQAHKDEPYPYGHSGFAWACTRAFWEHVGGLMDFPALGSADHHQAWALINKVDYSIHGGMSDSFKKMCHDWEYKAYQMTHSNVGFVSGALHHHWHGKKKDRKYRERWEILVDNAFDPVLDLRRDAQGLLYVYGKPQLEQDILEYFQARNEDSVDQE